MQSVTLVACALLATALALPQLPQRPFIPIVSRTVQFDPSGQYQHSYQSGDGATVQEQGFLKRTNDGQDNVVAKQGSFSYTSPEGVPVVVTYIADEYGFHPQSDNIPRNVQPIPATF